MRPGLFSALVLIACSRAQEPIALATVDAGPPPGVTAGVQLVREADTALQAGKLNEAVEKAALALEPSHPLASNVLGRALMLRFEKDHRAEDAVEAKAAFEQAMKGSPEFWPALQNLGALAEEQGRADEAAGDYQRLLEAEPTHPERARLEKLIHQADSGR